MAERSGKMKNRDAETAGDQAAAWIARLTSGEATVEDAAALQRWCGESEVHRQAFAEVKLLWDALGPAAQEVAPHGDGVGARARSATGIARRAFLGGALAASTGAIGYFGSRPPFHFWPSVSELFADYRTGTGEQRRIAVAANVSLILNTQTSINVQKASSGSHLIELISGEAAVTAKAAAPLQVLAADGLTSASAARFDVRREGANVRVTSLDGEVEIVKQHQSVTLPPGHQATYSGEGIGPVLAVDVVVATAWQQGMLIFRHETLARVIDEVNRYRPGRIILVDKDLAERDVVASIHIDRIDEIVEHIVQTFDARATFLPGGIVLLG